jgi:Ca-activated chloride channel family protein
MKILIKQRSLWLLVSLLFLAMLACGGSDGPPSNAVVIDVLANSSLQPWLETAVAQFNESETETAAGDPVFVQLAVADAGQAVVNLADGDNPSIWIPDHEVWPAVLAAQGNNAYTGDCASMAESPLVIAMWRGAAESLGWPGRELGWLDIGSLAADPTAWNYYSGGQYGDVLRLGHTHPGLSGTGTSTLLALVQAAEAQNEAVTVDDIEQPIVQASVGAFEGAVSWFSSDTANLAQTMAQRGTDFLGAAVMYESDVLQNSGGAEQLVPVYPFEGTFVATHPACLNGNLGGEEREAAGLFRDYLLGEEAQQLAVTNGLRPVNDSVAVGAPLDPGRGVDLAQPVVTFADPTVDTVFAVQDLWQQARKDVNLVMLIDVSGSMRGDKIANVQQAARQFVQQMGDDDIITIYAFSSRPDLIVDHQQVGPNRPQIIAAIDQLSASGDTALYDAIGSGAVKLQETSSPETANALVVLSDGQDTFSTRYRFDEALLNLVLDSGATVFTIAYGGDANENLLQELAFQANGNFFLGDEASIAAIYEEMSAAFGGSVGVGR